MRTLQRRGPVARVGELLRDGRVACVEELGAFLVAYARINKLFARLKRGIANVKSGRSVESLLEEYAEICASLGTEFDRASAEVLVADDPTCRSDISQEQRARLANAVTAFTEQLLRLHGEYDA